MTSDLPGGEVDFSVARSGKWNSAKQMLRVSRCCLAFAAWALLVAPADAQEALPGQRVRHQVIEEGFISVTGGKVWYRQLGAGKPAIPLLVLHGGPGAPSDYLQALEALSDERPVIFYDQLGCGHSDLPNDRTLWTVERYVEELGQVRRALQLNRVHLLGHSWGSMLAFEYYLTRKQSGVASLVSSGSFHSAPRWEADQQVHITNLPPEIQAIIRRNEADGTTASAEYRFAEEIYNKRHLSRSDPWPNAMKRSNATMGDMYSFMWGPTEFLCTGTLKGSDQTPRLREISVPTLFTVGEYDECRPETARLFQSMVPGAELKVFKNAAHNHHIDAADEYLASVRDFLRRCDAKSARADEQRAIGRD